MAAVLQFRSEVRRSRRQPQGVVGAASSPSGKGEVVIFPGVRIERTGIDLSHRLVQVSTADESTSGSPASTI